MTEQSKQGNVNDLRLGHWPHAARRLRDELDLSRLEDQAIRILARATRTERLVAFVGAGASVAYGRLAWAGLMRSLYAHIQKGPSGGNKPDPGKQRVEQARETPAWKNATDFLWRDAEQFAEYGDHVIKAQILDMALQPAETLLASGGLPRSQSPDADLGVRALVKEELEDFQGFLRSVVERWMGQRGKEQYDALRDEVERYERHSLATAKADHPLRASKSRGLREVVDILFDPALALDRQRGADAATKDVVKRLWEALMSQSVGLDSPLSTVVRDWSIRRFVTTNYDHEIERALEAQGFRSSASRTGPASGNMHSSVNFGRTQSAQALKLAFEGPRRHAEILHLHGNVSEPSTLVVTEEQYQRLYLQEHPTRDLVTNAALAVFAANPIIFIGSDAGEEDVIRPMRQFMTGEGHRSDRMAVALFPAIKDRDKRAERAVSLLLRHGVYAVHYGWDTEPGVEVNRFARGDEPWLQRLVKLQHDLQKACSAAESKPKSSVPMPKGWLKDFTALKAPAYMDGVAIPLGSELDLRPYLEPLKQEARALLGTARHAPAATKLSRLDRFLLRLDVFKDWAVSAFLCAKLKTLRERVRAQIDNDAKLALVYTRPKDDQPKATSPSVIARHQVSLSHPWFESRFQHLPLDGPIYHEEKRCFDEGISALCNHIERTDYIRRHTGRRLILVCGARGHGKGGQSDRLAQAREPDAAGGKKGYHDLLRLMDALGGYTDISGHRLPSHVLHLNLSFSNELGPIISQLATVFERAANTAVKTGTSQRTPDQLDAIDRGLRGLASLSVKGPRVMIILGNAGVLFDHRGEPKNGQISRVLRLMMAHRYTRAPLDIVMYVGESQMPAPFRTAQPDSTGASAGNSSLLDGEESGSSRARRRLERLNIRTETRGLYPVHMVHALSRTRLAELAAAYFPDVADELKWVTRRTDQDNVEVREFADRGSEASQQSGRLYSATGGSRFAMTVMLAMLDTESPALGLAQAGTSAVDRLAQEFLVALSGPPSGSAVERLIEFALDRWEARHVLGQALPMDRAMPRCPLAKRPRALQAVVRYMTSFCQQPSRESWRLATELLWHLGAFGQPVEAEVLMTCPGVAVAVEALPERAVNWDERLHAVSAMLELMVHWCLIFRINARPIPGKEAPNQAAKPQSVFRQRYALHRHMQRHVLRLMGGRNVEATQWDQFTITLYGSLPDEAPVMRAPVHARLTRLLQRLTDYPTAQPRQRPPEGEDGAFRHLVYDADCVRAAYYLVRSTYSLGVVSHLSPESSDLTAGCGHLEEYGRMVHWIIQAARQWEVKHGLVDHEFAPQDRAAARRWCNADPDKPWLPHQRNGIFYPGELVWLYNESGVIHLAQGRLNEAEEMLNLAEQAARRVEADSSGSLHTRIRIHSGLVQLERGRPQRAKQILQPISQRRNGHPVPPLLARFYLGQIDHVGGNYNAAHEQYTHALTQLRYHRRSRASAFVLISLSNLTFRMRTDRPEEALAIADEAISLAQQGGHEDVRHFAILERVRILIDSGRRDGDGRPGPFELLSAAERYAIRMEIPRLSCEVHQVRAQLLMSQGEYEMSARDTSASLEIASLYDLKLKKARGLLNLARIYHKRRDIEGARALAQMGQEIANACDYYTCVRGFKELELALESAV